MADFVVEDHLRRYREYLNPREGATPESRLISLTPWCLDYALQGDATVTKAILNEADRYSDRSSECRFSVVLFVAQGAKPKHVFDLFTSVSIQTWQHYEVRVGYEKGCSGDLKKAVLDARRRNDRIITLESDFTDEAQAYNALIDRADGKFLVFCTTDHILHPQLLTLYYRETLECDGLAVISTHHALCDDAAKQCREFISKPVLNFTMLKRGNYIGSCIAIRKDRLDLDGDILTLSGTPNALHAHLLQLAKKNELARHVPLFGYLQRGDCKSMAIAVDAGICNMEPQKICIAIPFKDHVDLTLKCLYSLEQQTTRHQLTVVLVDNNSVEERTNEILTKYLERAHGSVYFIRKTLKIPFNFAKLNNFAFEKYGKEQDLFLLLNNDVELTDPTAIEKMAETLLNDPKVAFVGIKLYYPDGVTVQHSGLSVQYSYHGSGYPNVSGIVGGNEFPNEDRVAMGVTFACAMVKSSIYEQLGRLDELNYPNGFGDVALCLQANRDGYCNYYLGSVSALHHESVSRTVASEDSEFYRLHREYADEIRKARILRWGVNVNPAFPPVLGQSEAGAAANGVPPELPWRYKAADKMSEVLRPVMAPVRAAKKALQKGLATK